MHGGIVQNHHRRVGQRQRKRIQPFADPGGSDFAFGEVRVALIVSVQQGEAVHAAMPVAGHDNLLIGELPAVGNARQQRDAAFVAVQKVQVALLGQGLELGENFALNGVDIRVGRTFYGSSNAFVAATVFFRNRRSVNDENSLPNSC